GIRDDLVTGVQTCALPISVTADVVRWEPFAGQILGRRLRTWVRPLQAGEAGGPAGQAVAPVASGGGAVLVWTGLALAWRRLRSQIGRASCRERRWRAGLGG